MCVYEYIVYLYCLQSIAEQGVVGQRLNSILVPSRPLCSGFFKDILIMAWGRPLLYTDRIFWGMRPPCNDLCFVLFRVAQYVIHQSCQEIQYTLGSRSYDYQFSIVCTLHQHMLLIECYTHVYSYIADDTIDI